MKAYFGSCRRAGRGCRVDGTGTISFRRFARPGSFPTGSFSQTQTSSNTALIEGAKSGFGFGLDVGLGLGLFGLYAGFDLHQFGRDHHL